MRYVEIDYPYNQGVSKVHLLETCEDVIEHHSRVCDSVEEWFRMVITSKVSPDRWDHMCWGGSLGDVAAGVAIGHTKMKGGNLWLNIDSLLRQKMMTMIGYILKGETIIMNSVGGYCFLDNSFTVIRDLEEDNNPLSGCSELVAGVYMD